MSRRSQLGAFPGRLVILGLGSIAQAMLPVLFDRFAISPGRVTVIRPGDEGTEVARQYGVRVVDEAVTRGNFRALLTPLLADGDFLLNLSVNVGSVDLVRLCAERGALYLDCCNEPWPGRYDNPRLSPTERSNYALREEMLALRRELREGPTACITQGANPGLVSAFVKAALLQMARDLRVEVAPPTHAEAWARLARRLGIRVIHIAERDTQIAREPKRRGEFVNTWSVEGFVDEGLQPAELGWGTHERHWPADALRHESGCGAGIVLDRPGIATRVRSWTPLQGPYHGFLVTHSEAISIPDHLSVREGGRVVYRPTVHYAYYPCDDAVASLHEIAGREWRLQPRMRILRDEIAAGMDELGVLMMGHPRGVFWYGSRLTIEQARALAPYNNATSMQVIAGILGPMAWALPNPREGIVEADDIDHRLVLEAGLPYLGDVVGVWGDWTPLADRSPLFPEPLDRDDPWQFVNFRVA